MMAFRKTGLIGLGMAAILVGCVVFAVPRIDPNPDYHRGAVLDQFNGIPVFYNGGVSQTSGRHLSDDGYNYGIRWQCVEFVKRYYHDALSHSMPDVWGHANDYFDQSLPHGALNEKRGLLQFRNGDTERPKVHDLVVFAPTIVSRYGHVAIISEIGESYVEIIQQNPGPFSPSRERFNLDVRNGLWSVEHKRLMGWLRLPATTSFINHSN